MNDKNLLISAYNRGYLNEKAKDKLIGYLRNELLDIQPDISKELAEGKPKRRLRNCDVPSGDINAEEAY